MPLDQVKSLDQAYKVMGYLPSQDELIRLVEYYQTYNWIHRVGLLNGFFSGKTIDELVDDKLAVMGKDRLKLTKQQIGGHKTWVIRKISKTIIRIMFLRYFINKGYSRKEANRFLKEDFPAKEGAKDPTSNIRKATSFILEDIPPPSFLKVD